MLHLWHSNGHLSNSNKGHLQLQHCSTPTISTHFVVHHSLAPSLTCKHFGEQALNQIKCKFCNFRIVRNQLRHPRIYKQSCLQQATFAAARLT